MAFDIKEIPLQFLSWGTPGIQNKILLEQDPRVPFFTTYTSIYDSEYVSVLSGGSILTFGKSLNISGDIFRKGSKLPSLNEIHNGILSDFYFSKTDFYTGCLDSFYPRIQGGIYDISIKKADPEIRLIETRGDEYTRITRTNTSNAATRYNRVLQPAVIDSYTSILLHCDGTDGSTTFSDSSANAHTVTAVGGTQIDTAQSKFGVSAGYFDGTGDSLTFPDHSSFQFGSGAFTIDFEVRWENAPADDTFCGGSTGSGGIWFLDHTANTMRLRFTNADGSAYIGIFYCTTSFSASTWYHIEVARSGATCYMFIDGNSKSVTQDDPFDTLPNYAAGHYINNGTFAGWIDEFRISKGIARHTANFTPPSSQYGTASTTEAQVWKAEDGVTAGEKGIITFGGTEQGNVYNGVTHKFKIDDTEKGRITSTVFSLGIGISCASIGTSVMSINNTTAPTTNSVGGCLWTSSGVLFYKGSAGTITSLGGA